VSSFRPLPTLDDAWRTSDPNDREKIRQYAMLRAKQEDLHPLTVAMNELAEVSPATVTQVQAWIDEIELLEQDWADKVSDGTAHLGNAKTYKGPIPGKTITRSEERRVLFRARKCRPGSTRSSCSSRTGRTR